MKKSLWFIIIFIFSFIFSFAQDNSRIIRITNTQIITPDTITLDTLTKGEQTYIKLIIKNERKNTVEITNIKTPPGTGVSLNNQTIKPKSQTELYIGFDSNWIPKTKDFVYKITLETNLIKNINIWVKGYIKDN